MHKWSASVASRRVVTLLFVCIRVGVERSSGRRIAVLCCALAHCSLFRRARLRPRRGSRVRCTCELPAGWLLLARAIFHSRIRNHECDKCSRVAAWRGVAYITRTLFKPLGLPALRSEAAASQNSQSALEAAGVPISGHFGGPRRRSTVCIGR